MKVIKIANENASACAPCGGQCCKGIPGVYHPDDLFPSMNDQQIKDKMLSMLNTGSFVITDGNITDDKGNYTIRVRALAPRAGKRSEGWFPTMNIGECVNLTATGCKLSSQDRPRECRALVPSPLGADHCKPESTFDREELLEEWSIYSHITDEMWDHQPGLIRL